MVATVTAANDYSKERQFQELNRVVESRKGKLSHHSLCTRSLGFPVSVMRNSRQTQIDIKDITVGDVVLIATGDSLPADGLVLEAAELHVDESSMTGESEAAVKSLQEDPYLLANTKVMAGTGRMLVVAVGTQSQWGRLKAMLDQPSEQTPLQIKLDALAERIGLVGVAAAVLTFVRNSACDERCLTNLDRVFCLHCGSRVTTISVRKRGSGASSLRCVAAVSVLPRQRLSGESLLPRRRESHRHRRARRPAARGHDVPRLLDAPHDEGQLPRPPPRGVRDHGRCNADLQ